MTPATIEYITSKIKQNSSPEQISGRLESKHDKAIIVRHEAIYKFIWSIKNKAAIFTLTYVEKPRNTHQEVKDARLLRVY